MSFESMVGLTLAGMTTIATAAVHPEDRDRRPAETRIYGEATVVSWDTPKRPSSVEQAIRYVDEQIDAVGRLSMGLIEKLGPLLAHDKDQGTPSEPSTRDRLTPVVRSQHAVTVAELGDRLAHLVDELRDTLARVDL